MLDKINEIDAYPHIGELTKIKNIKLSVGGCVPNVACDLKRIRPELDVRAIGKIGNDAEGKYIINYLENHGVNTQSIITTSKDKTSFTEVMSELGGQRTFFTYPGASSDFGFDDVNFENIGSILHLGYFLLLDKIDSGDGIKILKQAQDLSIKTSIDLVSENSDRYSLIIPCLQYTDYLIINELEAAKITGIEPTNENLEKIARKIFELGVKEKVIIHKTDISVALSQSGFTAVPSYNIAKDMIKGTTGAGDAFCAGALLGIYDNREDREILEFASATALVSLFEADATSGVKSEEEIKEICSNIERKNICL